MMHNFSTEFLFTTCKIPFAEICELVSIKVITVFYPKKIWFIIAEMYFCYKSPYDYFKCTFIFIQNEQNML